MVIPHRARTGLAGLVVVAASVAAGWPLLAGHLQHTAAPPVAASTAAPSTPAPTSTAAPPVVDVVPPATITADVGGRLVHCTYSPSGPDDYQCGPR